jgi:hypothetical protein
VQQEQGMHGQVRADAIAVAVDIDKYPADEDFVDDDRLGHGGGMTRVLLVNYFGRLNTCGRDGRNDTPVNTWYLGRSKADIRIFYASYTGLSGRADERRKVSFTAISTLGSVPSFCPEQKAAAFRLGRLGAVSPAGGRPI